ncbi:MAG TPA: hypothetical protein VFR46_13460 [Actinomycetes bacterium]|nr:hypothetical protein [Actinomycetes bacterium]
MSDSSKRQQPEAPVKRGDAAWRAARDEIARRNDEASRRARSRREAGYEQDRVRRVAAERLERAELAKRRP